MNTPDSVNAIDEAVAEHSRVDRLTDLLFANLSGVPSLLKGTICELADDKPRRLNRCHVGAYPVPGAHVVRRVRGEITHVGDEFALSSAQID